jgi:hypothetical protein
MLTRRVGQVHLGLELFENRVAWVDLEISIRQHTSAYVSIRQHTSAYVSFLRIGWPGLIWRECVSIRQHTSAYVSILLRKENFGAF